MTWRNARTYEVFGLLDGTYWSNGLTWVDLLYYTSEDEKNRKKKRKVSCNVYVMIS